MLMKLTPGGYSDNDTFPKNVAVCFHIRHFESTHNSRYQLIKK
jgi:hypothetical protein